MDCAICFHSFTISGPQEPKVLECGHTFCSHCVGFFKNQCATCRRNFRTTSTNFLLVELLNGKAESKSSNNEQLLERSTSQIEREIEECKRELELRRRREVQNELLNIEKSIELIQEEKSIIDNGLNELRGKIQNFERKSNERKTQIDRLNNEKLNLEKQLRTDLEKQLRTASTSTTTTIAPIAGIPFGSIRTTTSAPIAAIAPVTCSPFSFGSPFSFENAPVNKTVTAIAPIAGDPFDSIWTTTSDLFLGLNVPGPPFGSRGSSFSSSAAVPGNLAGGRSSFNDGKKYRIYDPKNKTWVNFGQGSVFL